MIGEEKGEQSLKKLVSMRTKCIYGEYGMWSLGSGVKSMFHPYLSFLIKNRERIENNQKK